MSDAMVSVLDVLDDPRALQGIRDDVLEMDLPSNGIWIRG